MDTKSNPLPIARRELMDSTRQAASGVGSATFFWLGMRQGPDSEGGDVKEGLEERVPVASDTGLVLYSLVGIVVESCPALLGLCGLCGSLVTSFHNVN